MKRVFLAGLAALAVGAAAAAQTTDESSIYYVNVPVEKVYSSQNGYVVTYRSTGNKMVRTYLPLEWFGAFEPDNPTKAAKAELIYLEPGSNWPSMTVYYKAGAFDHLRLYVTRSRGHLSWGSIPHNVNLDEAFAGVEEVTLEF